MFSRRGAGNAERSTGVLWSDFSREHRQFATKVVSTDNKNPFVPCASARVNFFSFFYIAKSGFYT